MRAARRHKELAGRGEAATFEGILADIRRRDARDSGRSDAPLKAAEDAVILDTSALTVEEAVAAAIAIVEARARPEGVNSAFSAQLSVLERIETGRTLP